jgi:DNA-directed RNA polymerase sigma subunit (sigma70/sigma32)
VAPSPTLLDAVRAAANELQKIEHDRAKAREKLREAILAAHAEKIPLAEIGRAAGLSRQRIRQLVEPR